MGLSAMHGAIAANHFLMNFLRTQIPFRAVVRRGDISTVQEEKDGCGLFAKTSLERVFLCMLPWSILDQEHIPLNL